MKIFFFKLDIKQMKLTGHYSDKIRLLFRLAKKVSLQLTKKWLPLFKLEWGSSFKLSGTLVDAVKCIDSFRISYSSLFGRYVAVKMIALLR